MEQPLDEFFKDFRGDLAANIQASGDFQLSEFVGAIAAQLVEAGAIEGFDLCYYRSSRGMQVDAYWFDDDNDLLSIIVADFDSREELMPLPSGEVATFFKRAEKFFSASKDNMLYEKLEETSPEYGLSRRISDRGDMIRRVDFFLISERKLSERFKGIDGDQVAGVPVSRDICDMARLSGWQSSSRALEPLDIDLEEFSGGLACLPASFGSDSHQSYLAIMPGELLADLYGQHGSRLLEQNVRAYLQNRGKVNKGIRTTILNEPEMFFAYNNGITATAQKVDISGPEDGLRITHIQDLQIVNGGQTTATLFHVHRKDGAKAQLDKIFVQMKLSVIKDQEQVETIVPKISEYANTQNRVNAADFFSNSPFHRRIEGFSRRILTPARRGEQGDTKWFYERARGQYADEQSRLSKKQANKFKAIFPKPQMFTKTDLAKFENVWDEHPRWVNLGAQKNFAQYAQRIGGEWGKSEGQFNEHYYRRIIVRALIFRRTEKLISEQHWYKGGYRANLVAYTIACLAELCRQRKLCIDSETIWKQQEVPDTLVDAMITTAGFVNDQIVEKPQEITNISEWCKREACWEGLKDNLGTLRAALSEDFWGDLISLAEHEEQRKDAKDDQRIDDGIAVQREVLEKGSQFWAEVLKVGTEKGMLQSRETNILKIAARIPDKIPDEKQSAKLMALVKRLEDEGVLVWSGA